MSFRILMIFAVLLALTTYVSAFFWSSSEEQSPATSYYYHKRLLQSPVYTVIDPSTRPRIPAVPMQMPLQAQFQPISNIHNVQLVPCLCPVTNEPQYSEPIPQALQPSQQDIYVSAQPQNYVQQQQQQQQTQK